MGSIVKTIGRAIKKVGKTLKRIAPVLLVAAAAYVGYGYMTGFQAGGWPQITEWGRSLMSGVSTGQTLSQSANVANANFGSQISPAIPSAGPADAAPYSAQTSPVGGAGSVAGTPLDVTTTPPLPEGAPLSPIQDTINNRYDCLVDGFSGGVSDFFFPPAEAATPPGSFAGQSLQAWGQPQTDGFSGGGAGPIGGGGWGDQVLGPDVESFADPSVVDPSVVDPSVVENDYMSGLSAYAAGPEMAGGAGGAASHLNDNTFMARLMSMGGKAWETYKKMWADNPGMAMWSTLNVLRTIERLVEKDDDRDRYDMGFKPGGWDDFRARYPNYKSSPQAPHWQEHHAKLASKRSPSVRPGPVPTEGRRISAIDRKPQGLVGQKTQGVLS